MKRILTAYLNGAENVGSLLFGEKNPIFGRYLKDSRLMRQDLSNLEKRNEDLEKFNRNLLDLIQVVEYIRDLERCQDESLGVLTQVMKKASDSDCKAVRDANRHYIAELKKSCSQYTATDDLKQFVKNLDIDYNEPISIADKLKENLPEEEETLTNEVKQ